MENLYGGGFEEFSQYTGGNGDKNKNNEKNNSIEINYYENLIIEKGTGIEIKFKHLSPELITNIYNFIKFKIINKQSETKNIEV